MSRTIKDMSFNAMERKAIARGFVNNDVYYGVQHRDDQLLACMDIVIEHGNDFLEDDWLSWLDDVNAEFPNIVHDMERDVNNIMPTGEHDDACGIDDDHKHYSHRYERTVNIIGNRASAMMAGRILEAFDPARHSLDVHRTVRTASRVDVIHVYRMVHYRYHEVCYADVRGYVRMMSAHDHHYSHKSSRWSDDVWVRDDSAGVRDGLHKAVLMYNSGIMDDDYDDGIVYGRRRMVGWW